VLIVDFKEAAQFWIVNGSTAHDQNSPWLSSTLEQTALGRHQGIRAAESRYTVIVPAAGKSRPNADIINAALSIAVMSNRTIRKTKIPSSYKAIFMSKWSPISTVEFKQLYEDQYKDLNEMEVLTFEKYKSDIFIVHLIRSNQYGKEKVFAVARKDDCVLYFYDVEDGFNVSEVNSENVVLQPGGSQATLKEAVQNWINPDAG